VAIIGAGVVLLAVFVLVPARRQGREPLLPFVLFRDRNYRRAEHDPADGFGAPAPLSWRWPRTSARRDLDHIERPRIPEIDSDTRPFRIDRTGARRQLIKTTQI